ncbi:MAG: hypothetical protein IKQ88_04020 [Lachnospiraceae bacterium]|nr:hypothetical protein [Lachnospiraceae bacterium]
MAEPPQGTECKGVIDQDGLDDRCHGQTVYLKLEKSCLKNGDNFIGRRMV